MCLSQQFNGIDSASKSSPITHLVTLSVLDLASSNFFCLTHFFFPPTLIPPSHPTLFYCFCKPHNEFLSGPTEMLLFLSCFLQSEMLQLLTSLYLSSSNPPFQPVCVCACVLGTFKNARPLRERKLEDTLCVFGKKNCLWRFCSLPRHFSAPWTVSKYVCHAHTLLCRHMNLCLVSVQDMC